MFKHLFSPLFQRFPFFLVICLGLAFIADAQTASSSEMEQQAIAAAEVKYPLYHPGENIVISFDSGKGTRITYHGTYRVISPTKIQIGKNYVTIADLPENLQARFDADLNAQLREKEVNRLLGQANVAHPMDRTEESSARKFTTTFDDAETSDSDSLNDHSSNDRDEADVARQSVEAAMKRAEEVMSKNLSHDTYLQAQLSRQKGREAYRDRDFQNAAKLFGEAERLYRQSIEEGRAKLERDAKAALSKEQWKALREIAAWMSRFDSERGAELFRQTDQAESDAHYSRGEDALARHDWAAVRQFADLLYYLDEGRYKDLKKRANRGEADELTAWIKQVIQQYDWTRARQYCVRLKELYPKEADAMNKEVNQAEIAHCIELASDAIANHEWAKGRKIILRISAIEPGNAEASKMLALADKGEIAELTAAAKNAIARHDWATARTCLSRIRQIQPDNADVRQLLSRADKGEEDDLFAEATAAMKNEDWPKLYDRAHRLEEFNPKRAKPFLDKLKRIGDIRIPVTVTVEKWYYSPYDEWKYSCEYILYENNTRIASKNSQQMAVIFENVEVSLGATLRAEMLPKNGFGAIAETLEAEEKVIVKVRNQEITLKCK